MSKKFIEGGIYVFTKKKFIQRMGKVYEQEKNWVNGLNGNQVILNSQFTGDIRHNLVIPQWCKCIKEVRR